MKINDIAFSFTVVFNTSGFFFHWWKGFFFNKGQTNLVDWKVGFCFQVYQYNIKRLTIFLGRKKYVPINPGKIIEENREDSFPSIFYQFEVYNKWNKTNDTITLVSGKRVTYFEKHPEFGTMINVLIPGEETRKLGYVVPFAIWDTSKAKIKQEAIKTVKGLLSFHYVNGKGRKQRDLK